MQTDADAPYLIDGLVERVGILFDQEQALRHLGEIADRIAVGFDERFEHGVPACERNPLQKTKPRVVKNAEHRRHVFAGVDDGFQKRPTDRPNVGGVCLPRVVSEPFRFFLQRMPFEPCRRLDYIDGPYVKGAPFERRWGGQIEKEHDIVMTVVHTGSVSARRRSSGGRFHGSDAYAGTHTMDAEDFWQERTDIMDTLKRIALDWLDGRIGDREARRRVAQLPPVVHHRDDDPYTGDGGWVEGDSDNTVAAVEALIEPGGASFEQVRRFLAAIG